MEIKGYICFVEEDCLTQFSNKIETYESALKYAEVIKETLGYNLVILAIV